MPWSVDTTAGRPSVGVLRNRTDGAITAAALITTTSGSRDKRAISGVLNEFANSLRVRRM
jgi:hypothetical protein